MSSGYKEQVINPNERVASSDINRLQKHVGYDFAEFFRYMLDVYAEEESAAGGTITVPSAIETPLRAEIINGLLVRPQAGVFDLFVDPGVAYFMAPDGGADESPYKFIRDDGIQTTSVLQVVANGSGSTRVDVIECAIDPLEIVTTEVRDLFNTTTGVFTPALLTKVKTGRLQYRVRQGVPGSPPTLALGWLPLAIVSLPAGAASNDACTFWDVRPLISDRVNTPFQITRLNADYGTQAVVFDDVSTPGENRMSGTTRATLNGRWVGGEVRAGNEGGSNNNFLDLLAVENQEDGFALPVSGIVYVYLVTPFGLPRWARYRMLPQVRTPRSPRGILILSTVAPLNTGYASTTITLPTTMGLGNYVVDSADAVCVGSLPVTASALKGGCIDGQVQWLRKDTATGQNGIEVSADGGFDATSSTFSIDPDVEIPAHAKAIYASFSALVTVANGVGVMETDGEFEVQTAGGLGLAYGHTGRLTFLNNSGSAQNANLSTPTIRIPIVPSFPGGASQRKVKWRYAMNGGTISGTPVLRIYGWEV